MKKTLIFLSILTIAVAGGWLWLGRNDSNGGDQHAQADHSHLNKHKYSLDDPASQWVVVNKTRPLNPKTYQPNDLVNPNIPLRLDAANEEMKLRKTTAQALERLTNDASKDGLKLMLASGYRSHDFQVDLYNTYVKQQGQAEADKQSARPGYSEHQTGLAADLEPTSRNCEVEECFADTPEGKWLAAHAHEYGFVIRYAKDKQSTTGYIYEPWHLRYVGKALAQEMHDHRIATLEEFFKLPGAPDYK